MSDREALVELESRMAWYERQLSELDGVVRALYDEVARLRRQVDDLSESEAPEIGPANEPPPHW